MWPLALAIVITLIAVSLRQTRWVIPSTGRQPVRVCILRGRGAVVLSDQGPLPTETGELRVDLRPRTRCTFADQLCAYRVVRSIFSADLCAASERPQSTGMVGWSMLRHGPVR